VRFRLIRGKQHGPTAETGGDPSGRCDEHHHRVVLKPFSRSHIRLIKAASNPHLTTLRVSHAAHHSGRKYIAAKDLLPNVASYMAASVSIAWRGGPHGRQRALLLLLCRRLPLPPEGAPGSTTLQDHVCHRLMYDY